MHELCTKCCWAGLNGTPDVMSQAIIVLIKFLATLSAFEGSTVPENTTAPNIIKVLKTTLSMTRFYYAGLIREDGMRVYLHSK